jgi:phage terminase small subunit
MTQRETRFVEAYLSNGHNATEAAKTAGYAKGSAHVTGSRLLRKAKVAAAIEARKAEVAAQLEADTGLTLKRVVEELGRVALFDPRALFGANGELLDPKDWPEDVARAVASLEVSKRSDDDDVAITTSKVRAWDKVRALELLGKHLGAFRDKVEHTGTIEIRWQE